MQRVLESLNAVSTSWHSVERLDALLPHTMVHGDLVAKNVRVVEGPAAASMVVFDWRTAGWGTALADLAYAPPGLPKLALSPDFEAFRHALRGSEPPARFAPSLIAAATLLRLLAAIEWTAQSLTDEGCDHVVMLLMEYGRAVDAAVEHLNASR